MTDDLVAWLRAQLDEDELWALAASAPFHGNGPTVAGGVTWTWAVGENWDPIDVDPIASYVGEPNDTGYVTLITREVFPLTWDPRGLNGRVLTAEEIRTGDAGHIVRHHPKRVVDEVKAKRRIIDEILRYELDMCEEHGCSHDPGKCPYRTVDDIVSLRLLALPYADRPGYREEWRPPSATGSSE